MLSNKTILAIYIYPDLVINFNRRDVDMDYFITNDELAAYLKSPNVKKLQKEGIHFLKILNSCRKINKAGKEKFKDNEFARSQPIYIYEGFYKDVAADLGVELTPALDSILSDILLISEL